MGNALLLIIAGLVLFYVVISDKFYCIEGCVSCLLGTGGGLAGGASGAVGVAPAPAANSAVGGVRNILG